MIKMKKFIVGMMLTATLGASSEARLLAKPSRAALDAAMEEWNVIPLLAATEEMKTTEAPSSFLRLDKTFLIILKAPSTLILKSSLIQTMECLLSRMMEMHNNQVLSY